MPEFILDHGGVDGSRWLSDLDEFTAGYVECLFFVAPDDSPEGNGRGNTMESASVSELSIEARATIVADCTAFQAQASALLARAYTSALDTGKVYTAEQAGRDFCYTRNGHGAGFWDRGLPDDIGDGLSDVARKAGESDLYRGDSGKLYLGG